MTSADKTVSRRPMRYWLRKIHRWASLAAALPLLLLTLTGVMLNHKEVFGHKKPAAGAATKTMQKNTGPAAGAPDSKKAFDPMRLAKDLHKGKIAGAVGTVLLDVTSLLLLISSVSGLLLLKRL